ncbi:MAG: IS30 family transposase [Saprospiraceae bacterium]|nr:IS30 family transposase [Saprospiraceae bacterium]
MNAQELYFRRRKKLRKVERLSGLKDHIIQGLKRHWSPEQIAGQLRASIGLPHCISHETIYRFIYSTEGKEHGLYKFYIDHVNFDPDALKKTRALRGLPDHVHIRYRPDYIDNRLEFGHWEADLMMFQRDKSTSNITTLIERKSRFTIFY